MLETELKELALGEGSIRAGIARREAFTEAPPSEKDWGQIFPLDKSSCFVNIDAWQDP